MVAFGRSVLEGKSLIEIKVFLARNLDVCTGTKTFNRDWQ
ncbi:unnamed protein product [Strongylus vulgaris]|uniref:Uncharacterized protein n=1 Tax=Strongylus vulgaris TaxID=40348 RepID=A0A3P7JH01_STRVU|nr:unnamed protein product [Strongylus vulgaris]